MADRFSEKKNLERLTVKELIKKGYKLNEKIMKLIYSNTIIKDLPAMAALYGLYSSFVIGYKKVYFVFGYNKNAVHYSTLVEAADGYVYIKDDLDKTGFTSGIDGLYCTKFNSIPIDENTTAIDLRMAFYKIRDVETIVNGYRRFGLDLPDYVYYDGSIMAELYDIIFYTDNKKIKPFMKDRKREEEIGLLKDIAIPEWPISPSGRKPGYIAFVSLSRYNPSSENTILESSFYNMPIRWNAEFKKRMKKSQITKFTCDEKKAEFLKAEFKKRDIPFYDISAFDKAKKKRDSIYNDTSYVRKRIFKEYQVYDDEMKYTTFVIHPFDEGILKYVLSLYPDTLFTDEQKKYGNSLFYSYYQDRLKESGKYVPCASFIFYVPESDIETFLTYINERTDVKIGYCDADALRNDPAMGIPMIVDIIDMPVVEYYLRKTMFLIMSFHSNCVDKDASCEHRIFEPKGYSVIQNKIPWDIFDSEMKCFLKANSSGLVRPKSDFTQQGLLIDNDPDHYDSDIFNDKPIRIVNVRMVDDSSKADLL